MLNRTCLLTAAIALANSAPAFAEGGTAVPEANTVSLMSLALAGVLIGRRMAKQRPPEG